MTMFVRIHFTLVVAILSIGCAASRVPPLAALPRINFPYEATAERKSQIINALSEIKTGMTISRVQNLAGNPDDILPLFEPMIKNGNQIGKTYWYYIQIEKPGDNTNASLMRISTDLDGIVSHVDHWGFDPNLENVR